LEEKYGRDLATKSALSSNYNTITRINNIKQKINDLNEKILTQKELQELKEEKVQKLINSVAQFQRRRVASELFANIEKKTEKKIQQINEAKTKEEVKNIKSEPNLSASTAPTESFKNKIYVDIKKQYNNDDQVVSYLEKLYSVEDLRKIIKDPIFANSDLKLDMINKTLNWPPAVADIKGYEPSWIEYAD